MFRILFLIFLLNNYDAGITLWCVNYIGATEINPLFATMVIDEPVLFVFIKNAVCLLVLASLALGFKHHEHGYSFKRTAYIILVISVLVCLWNSIVLMSSLV